MGGILAGIVGGALWMIIQQMRAGRKARRDYKSGKNTFVLNEGEDPKSKPTKPQAETKPVKKVPVVPDLKVVTKPVKKEVPEVPEPKPEPKERNYKKDLKLFKKANKKLEKLKVKQEKGIITLEELKQEFGYYQNQDYYKYIIEKDYDKK